MIFTPTATAWLGPQQELEDRLPNPHAYTVPFEVVADISCWSEWFDLTTSSLTQTLQAWCAAREDRSVRLSVAAYSVAGLLVTGWQPPSVYAEYNFILIDPSSKSALWRRFAESNIFPMTEAVLAQWEQLPELPPLFAEQGGRLCSVEWHMPKPQGRWFVAAENEDKGAATMRGASGNCLSDTAMEVLWEEHQRWIRERTTRLCVLGKKVNHSSAWRNWLGQLKKLRN